MTHAISTYHVFYSEDRMPEEGSALIRVFITEDKISVSERVLKATSTPGQLAEVVLHRYYYELKTNTSGMKYLKFSRQDEDGKVHDESMTFLLRNLVWGNFVGRQVKLENEAPLRDLISETLCRWFDYSAPVDLNVFAVRILFPALSNLASGVRYVGCPPHMKELQPMLTLYNTLPEGRVLKALRENTNWNEFVEKVCCKETVVNKEELEIVSNQPALLRLATMRLGMTITDINELEQIPYDFLNAFCQRPQDTRLIAFMLDFLPEDQRFEASMMMFSIASRYAKALGSKTVGYFSPGSYREFNLIPENLIPLSLRPAAAQALFARIRDGVEPQITAIEESAVIISNNVELELLKTLAFWYAEFVIEPSLESNLTVQNVLERFTELYGDELLTERGLPISQSNTGNYCARVNTSETPQPDALELLERVCLGPSQRYEKSKYHPKEWEELLTPGIEFYSLDSLLKLIETSSKIIDRSLIELGRAVTPANRAAYLVFAHRERDQKKTWYYYDFGVTDPSKIIALKMCKIKDESEIRMYAALPDELFYELIGLQNEKAVEDSIYFGSVQSYNTEAKRYSPPSIRVQFEGIDAYNRLISDTKKVVIT